MYFKGEVSFTSVAAALQDSSFFHRKSKRVLSLVKGHTTKHLPEFYSSTGKTSNFPGKYLQGSWGLVADCFEAGSKPPCPDLNFWEATE